MRASRPSARDEGSASVLVVGVVAAIVTITVGLLAVAAAVLASHRARLAADLAALAGATRLESGSPSDACAVAAGVAERNHGRLVTCRPIGPVLDLTVAVPAWPWPAEAVARSRAGPITASITASTSASITASTTASTSAQTSRRAGPDAFAHQARLAADQSRSPASVHFCGRYHPEPVVVA